MKYVDANILIRIITQDDPKLAASAEELLSSQKPKSVFVLSAVIEEVIFVLMKYDKYVLTRNVISNALRQFFDRSELVITNDLQEAIIMFGSHTKLDFVDCLLAVKGKYQKKNVLTFDADLQKALE